MSSYTNSNNYLITTLETLPLSSSLTGTVSVVNTKTAVVGVATLFTTEIGYSGSDISIQSTSPTKLGWLWDTTNGEIRRITDVLSATLLYIEEPFTNNLAGATVKLVPVSRYKAIEWTDTGGGGGEVNGIALSPAESGGVFAGDFRNTNVDPIIFDGTGGDIAVTVSYV